MTDPVHLLLEEGFDRVEVLDGAQCGIDAPTLILAFQFYQAESNTDQTIPWIHPYYYASQRAYTAAVKAAAECPGLSSRDEIRVKPIFARIPWLTQGRNTISYLSGQGSRFHVQIFTYDETIPATVELLPEPKTLHCGECRLCIERCPTGAIDEEGFHRERCIRNWQLSGQIVPEAVREAMGNRLIGCDSCQIHCPHNPSAEKESRSVIGFEELLNDTKTACEKLKPMIGSNLAIRNRVLSQAVMMAGSIGQQRFEERIQQIASEHPSPVVREHANWAIERINKGEMND